MPSVTKNASVATAIHRHSKDSALQFVYSKNDTTKYAFVKNRLYGGVVRQPIVQRKNPL